MDQLDQLDQNLLSRGQRSAEVIEKKHEKTVYGGIWVLASPMYLHSTQLDAVCVAGGQLQAIPLVLPSTEPLVMHLDAAA